MDSIKWSDDFHANYLEKNKILFFKLWGKLLLKNPNHYMKAYLLNTLGFWDIQKVTKDGYVSNTIWPGIENVFNVKQRDYIKDIFSFSIRKKIDSLKPINSALFIWIILFMILMVIYLKKYHYLFVYVPLVSLWLTIMIATPLAFSMRYVFSLVLTLPFCIIFPLLRKKNQINF